jgi:hypothetical protein
VAMVPSAIATASCGHVQLEASWRRTSDKGSQAQEETPPLTSRFGSGPRGTYYRHGELEPRLLNGVVRKARQFLDARFNTSVHSFRRWNGQHSPRDHETDGLTVSHSGTPGPG